MEEDPLNTLLEQAEDSAQDMEVMVVFKKDPLLQPPPWKGKKIIIIFSVKSFQFLNQLLT